MRKTTRKKYHVKKTRKLYCKRDINKLQVEWYPMFFIFFIRANCILSPHKTHHLSLARYRLLRNCANSSRLNWLLLYPFIDFSRKKKTSWDFCVCHFLDRMMNFTPHLHISQLFFLFPLDLISAFSQELNWIQCLVLMCEEWMRILKDEYLLTLKHFQCELKIHDCLKVITTLCNVKNWKLIKKNSFN